jgi:protein associated with RNAse G/E
VSELHTPATHDAARPVTVSALKFDGRVHRSWPARVRRRAGALVVLEGVFDEEVRHPLLGHIVPGTLSTEYYWTDRWYSVFRFREPDGRLRNYYCNINQPARFDGSNLTFVDLDIDVLVAPDFTYTVLDEDEFERHAAEFNYPPALHTQVHDALAELLSLIERREFPFST